MISLPPPLHIHKSEPCLGSFHSELPLAKVAAAPAGAQRAGRQPRELAQREAQRVSADLGAGWICSARGLLPPRALRPDAEREVTQGWPAGRACLAAGDRMPGCA